MMNNECGMMNMDVASLCCFYNMSLYRRVGCATNKRKYL